MFWQDTLVIAKLFAFVWVLTEFRPMCRPLIRQSAYLIVENDTISTPSLGEWLGTLFSLCTVQLLSNLLRQTTVQKSLTGLFQ